MSWPFSTLRPAARGASIAEISVDDLAKGAGISRPTFYFYFPSKDAVLSTLFERVISEADAAFDEHIGMPACHGSLRDVPRRHRVFFETFGAPSGRDPRRARSAGTSCPRSATCWARFMTEVDRQHGGIDRSRTRAGTAPTTLPALRSRDGVEPDERAGDVRLVRRRTARDPAGPASRHLVHIWVTSIYGDTLDSSSDPDANICSCRAAPPSCTPISTRSTRRSSSVTTPRCAAGR